MVIWQTDKEEITNTVTDKFIVWTSEKEEFL